MEIEVKIDGQCNTPKVIIYTNEMNDEVTEIIDGLSSIKKKILKGYKDNKIYILNQNEIETIYSEQGKIYARLNNDVYTIKNRLYELEELLDGKSFIRISNSEIVNFNKVENIDFKIVGTWIINFKSGNKSYASRRYITKIKKYLEL